MKLAEIKIRGYKSIEELDFPIRKYGESYTTILIGKNETGKSNVLDAMATPQNEEKVNFVKIKNQQTEPETVSVFFVFDVEDSDDCRKAISEVVDIPQALLDALKISQISKEMYLQNNIDEFAVDCDYSAEKVSVKKYSYTKTKETTPATPSVPAETTEKVTIKANSELTEEEKASYTQLDDTSFREIIQSALLDFVNELEIPIDEWKYDDKYLVEDKIDLKTFAEKPDSNVPLKNMFYLAGYDSQSKIESKIAEIEKDNNKRRKLEKELSTSTTKYLNEKWKEHEVDIEAEIESSNLNIAVSVKDKADENGYYDMSDRSQGFKQFVSLLLSISISSKSGDTKDHLILIDEPEVHLHPSGVRWMLKELLEIGKNNYLFISTHSNFMLDKDNKERHYLLTKSKKGLTEAQHIKTEDDINDDEVLQSAFGINVITDFLTDYTLLVEGASDKKLLQKALKAVKADNDVLITNGTGSNIVAVASYLMLNNVCPMVIVDDDSAGRDAKDKILKIDDGFTGKTFTIRDLDGNITDSGTIEDTLPKDFVESKTKEVLRSHSIADTISLDDTKPFCEQIILHYNTSTSQDTTTTKKDKKQKLDTILIEIKSKISDYDQKAITQAKAPRLYKLAEEILSKFGIS